ncbi:hypothetical protein [Pedobacter sp. UBA5917]|jgi:hypothetical protein|uniref:hypothetical protein n=1 Tax=Pedobacter sp. UBA5917 TaxID=1947061 RepID=UPI0026001FB4|nr:hypothetical protein [Pedobacter sp. UBA5917]
MYIGILKGENKAKACAMLGIVNFLPPVQVWEIAAQFGMQYFINPAIIWRMVNFCGFYAKLVVFKLLSGILMPVDPLIDQIQLYIVV